VKSFKGIDLQYSMKTSAAPGEKVIKKEKRTKVAGNKELLIGTGLLLKKEVSKKVHHECFLDADFPRNAKCLIDETDEADLLSTWQTNPEKIEWIRARDIPSL